MTDLPAPLTPPDCDLRGYDFMPLHGHRLFNSDFYYGVSAEAFRAGLRLWWAAWQQSPAASLPDDDTMLCRLADMGRDMKGWKALRAEALRGFVPCADGRLYHPVIAELALEAWQRRRRERDRKAAFRNARRGQGADSPRDNEAASADEDTDNGDASAGHPVGQSPTRARRQDRRGQERKEDYPLTPAAGAAGGPGQSSIIEGKPPPRGSRASGTNPRAVAAAAEAAKPPPPDPDSPLWPAFRAVGMTGAEFRHWIGPLVRVDGIDQRAVLFAPTRFHADHVRREFGPVLERACAGPVDIRGPDAVGAVVA